MTKHESRLGGWIGSIVIGLVLGYGFMFLARTGVSEREFMVFGAVASIAVMLMTYVVYDLLMERRER